MNQPAYNKPFYFALPRAGARPGQVSEARRHIAATFGVRGPAEYVRTDATFYLFRVVGS